MLRSKPRPPVVFAAFFCCAASFAQPLPMATHPEDVGFSSKRLETTREVLKADVEAKRLPGAVLLMARNGKIAFYDVVGYQDRDAQTPMKKDSIFRIASMSKPITTVAAMILAEENKLDVAAPVAQYLPEFKDVKVGPEGVAPKRPIRDMWERSALTRSPPLRPAARASSLVNSWAVPFWWAAIPPFRAISRSTPSNAPLVDPWGERA